MYKKYNRFKIKIKKREKEKKGKLHRTAKAPRPGSGL